jgi:hypothetical protein
MGKSPAPASVESGTATQWTVLYWNNSLPQVPLAMPPCGFRRIHGYTERREELRGDV